MMSEQISDTNFREYLEQLQATIEYLGILVPADLSPEEYLEIEESIVRLYARKRISHAVNDILRPALSELTATVGRVCELRHETMNHANRAANQSRAADRVTRSLSRNRYFQGIPGKKV